MWCRGFCHQPLGVCAGDGRLGFVDCADKANQSLVKKALEILPDKAIKELGNEDLSQWVVVRVNDDITVDLMHRDVRSNF